MTPAPPRQRGTRPSAVPVDGQVLAHLAVALSRYVDDARRYRWQIPDEVRQLAGLAAALVVEARDPPRTATGRQRAPAPARNADRREAAEMPEPQLLSLAEVARRLDVSRRAVDRVVAADELTAVRIGGLVKVRPADLDAYVANLPLRTSAPHVEVIRRAGT